MNRRFTVADAMECFHTKVHNTQTNRSEPGIRHINFEPIADTGRTVIGITAFCFDPDEVVPAKGLLEVDRLKIHRFYLGSPDIDLLLDLRSDSFEVMIAAAEAVAAIAETDLTNHQGE